MRPIPPAHRKLIDSDSWYNACCFPDKTNCQGRTEVHHACQYQGRQISEMFNYIPLCHYHHDTQIGKDWASLLAITRMTSEDKARFPRRDWNQEAAKYLFKLQNYDRSTN